MNLVANWCMSSISFNTHVRSHSDLSKSGPMATTKVPVQLCRLLLKLWRYAQQYRNVDRYRKYQPCACSWWTCPFSIASHYLGPHNIVIRYLWLCQDTHLLNKLWYGYMKSNTVLWFFTQNMRTLCTTRVYVPPWIPFMNSWYLVFPIWLSPPSDIFYEIGNAESRSAVSNCI